MDNSGYDTTSLSEIRRRQSILPVISPADISQDVYSRKEHGDSYVMEVISHDNCLASQATDDKVRNSCQYFPVVKLQLR